MGRRANDGFLAEFFESYLPAFWTGWHVENQRGFLVVLAGVGSLVFLAPPGFRVGRVFARRLGGGLEFQCGIECLLGIARLVLYPRTGLFRPGFARDPSG